MPRRQKRLTAAQKRAQEHQRRQEMAFGAALNEMRAYAHGAVSDALEEASDLYPDHIADELVQAEQAPQDYLSPGDLLHEKAVAATYDGVLEALADQILGRSRLGEESIIAAQVAERLKWLVELKACYGRA